MLAQMNVNTETRTTLVSDFHHFRVEYAVNKLILLFFYCKLTIDKQQHFTFDLHLMNEFLVMYVKIEMNQNEDIHVSLIYIKMPI